MRRLLSLLLLASLLGACLAPPPPIVVETPFGVVRASSKDKASEIATLLRRLAPQVRALLPGSQDRPIDVWVQENLRVYRFQERPKSVRGFTLLSGEFEAKRIHLQESGQSPWYLAHELVHALIGPSWHTLPGILEEGLGDVVAEKLNREYQKHIRAHRLLNASAFTDGVDLTLRYNEPGRSNRRQPRRLWPQTEETVRLRTQDPVPEGTLLKLLQTPRSELHQTWTEIPESFYGLSWLIVSRIEERHGLEGIHDLCGRAAREGYELVPAEWILEYAQLDAATLDAAFLRTAFKTEDLHTAIYLQPDAFADSLVQALAPMRERFGFRSFFFNSSAALIAADGTELQLKYYRPPLVSRIEKLWGSVADDTAARQLLLDSP